MQRFLNDLKDKAERLEVNNPEKEALTKRYHKLSNFKENLHYVFVEYQGSNITHWNFAESDEESRDTPARKLSKDIFLLADNDIKTKGSRVEDLEKALGNHFHLLEFKEIENYIPQNVIIATAQERWGTFKGKADSTFDPTSFKPHAFQIKTKGIGYKLETAITHIGSVDSSRKFFADKSGTIKDKVKFCETACSIMKNKKVEWVLTPELENLCDEIWTFIESNNKGSI